MFLGRRKDGFTQEQTVKPSEIPNYVNEQNDTTFAKRGDGSVRQEEPQEWIVPEPMPMYRLLREYIRSQSEIGLIVPRLPLLAEDSTAAGLLEEIGADPSCADVEVINGEKDVYYYSREKMSRFVAWISALVIEDDLPRTIAEITRYNCVTYPAPTLKEYFTMSPFGYSQERIDEALLRIRADKRYQDIRMLVSDAGRPYLYSAEKMSEKYARALSSNLDRAPVD